MPKRLFSPVAVFVAFCVAAIVLHRAEAGIAGVDVSASATIDMMANASGGLRRGLRTLDRLDVGLNVSADPYGLEGASLFVDGQQTAGGGLSARYIGDTQGVSNIDAPGGILLYQAWIQKAWKDTAALKLGLIDLNSEFDVQDVGVLFVNSSFGIGAEYSHTGAAGPSIFPFPGLGLTGNVRLSEGVKLRAAVFSAVPRDPQHPRGFAFPVSDKDGAFIPAEIEIDLDRNTILKLGSWFYTADFERLEPAGETVHGDFGLYGSLSARLWQSGESGPSLNAWVRGGVADEAVNVVAGYVGGGLVFTGLFPARSADQLGVGIACAMNGEPARRQARAQDGSLAAAETTVELTYAAPLTAWLTVQPDVQYVFNPVTSIQSDHALAVGIRFSMSLPMG